MLFSDRIRLLDRRILPGVTKLTWTSDRHSLDFYYKEARRYCKDVDLIVADYKARPQTNSSDHFSGCLVV